MRKSVFSVDRNSFYRESSFAYYLKRFQRRQEIITFRKQAASSENYLQDAFAAIRNEYHATGWALFSISKSPEKVFWAEKLLPDHYDHVRSHFSPKKEVSKLLKILERKEMYSKALQVLQESDLESRMPWDKVKFHLKLRQPMDAMKVLMTLVTKNPENLRARAYTGMLKIIYLVFL